MPTALLIPADEQAPIHRLDIDGLSALQTAVGGFIESVPFPGRSDVVPYFNEEGKLEGLAPNRRATTLLRTSMFPGDFIAGDLVLVGEDASGQLVDCPDLSGLPGLEVIA